MFESYFELGVRHILDFSAYDHMLFVAVLVAPYPPQAWKKLLLLVTAFTLGHSLSLALATLHIVSANMSIIEFLIPVTIFITAMLNFLPESKKERAVASRMSAVVLVVFFGLIHGLGFSNYLGQLLGEGNLAVPLLAFNLGVEAGQLLIVAVLLILAFFVTLVPFLTLRHWKFAVSGVAAIVSLHLAFLAKSW